MTGRSDFDREMTAYLEARSTSRAPDGLLDAVVAGVEITRQRPGWLILEWWLPSRATRGATRIGKAAVLLGILALLVALAVALIVVVGSQRRLPAPFGLARPGLIAYDLTGHIFVANPDGTGQTQLTFGPNADGGATWSPDGTRIAYASALAEGGTSVIMMGADGQHRVAVAGRLRDVGDIVWSPDSRRVAFGARVAGSDSSHIYVADVDRPGAIQLGPPDLLGEEPSWSPDGREIAFKWTYACCGPKALPDALWLIDADGTNAHPLWTNQDQVGSGDNALWNTAWSPDGTKIAFLAAGDDGRFDVFVVNRDGTEPRNITKSPEDEFWPSWSPDGTRIAFPRMSLTEPNAGHFIVVDSDGSHPIELKDPWINSNTPVWSPDGTRVLGYAKNPDPSLDTNAAIAIFDATGSLPPKTFPAADFNSASWQRLAP